MKNLERDFPKIQEFIDAWKGLKELAIKEKKKVNPEILGILKDFYVVDDLPAVSR